MTRDNMRNRQHCTDCGTPGASACSWCAGSRSDGPVYYQPAKRQRRARFWRQRQWSWFFADL